MFDQEERSHHRNESGKDFASAVNHARKLSEASIDLFCSVMKACPNAELVLKSISFHEDAEKTRIQQRFKNAGLDPNRLKLLSWVEGGINHLQLYRHMDVALDPIPYGGATTTAEALWMGVPDKPFRNRDSRTVVSQFYIMG